MLQKLNAPRTKFCRAKKSCVEEVQEIGETGKELKKKEGE
jgi:hypothetical protein